MRTVSLHGDLAELDAHARPALEQPVQRRVDVGHLVDFGLGTVVHRVGKEHAAEFVVEHDVIEEERGGELVEVELEAPVVEKRDLDDALLGLTVAGVGDVVALEQLKLDGSVYEAAVGQVHRIGGHEQYAHLHADASVVRVRLGYGEVQDGLVVVQFVERVGIGVHC